MTGDTASQGWTIVRATTVQQLKDAEALFDAPVLDGPASEFVGDPRHHLLLAVDFAGVALGFVSGVVLVHPDKGGEMFLYELGVDATARRRGVATSLVGALAQLARDLGCRGMWVLTDDDNAAALGAYRRAGGTATGQSQRMLEWTFSD